MVSQQVLELIAAAHRDRATKLDLSGQKLTELPESIFEIDSLVELDLSNNKLRCIPNAITKLINLSYLNIDVNLINDLLILQSMSKLEKVRYLDVYLPRSCWTKIDEEIVVKSKKIPFLGEVLIKIEDSKKSRDPKLVLTGRKLKVLPRSLGDLTHLNYLDLSCNNLELIPDSIGNLINLIHLDLESNDLTELPESIGNLVNLKVLNIYRNRFARLPKNLGNLTKITKLRPCRYNVAKSQLSILPESIGNLTNLTRLDLPGCQLTELPESIGNLTKLSRLYISSNQLRKLPQSIGDLARLSQLYANDNQLITLPDSFSKLERLKNIDLCANQITELPQSITSLTKLVTLSISRNLITELPDKIGKLTKLKRLAVAVNHIKKLPASIVNCIELTEIILNGNPIEDLSILQNMPALQEVWIFNVNLPRKYWIEFSDWKAKWLLDETNVEIRRALIGQLGYEKICDELGAIEIDTWQEYTLLKIDNMEIVYQGWQEVGREPMMLLKMTCPSTAHIHILRVPPDMTSAEDAIVWVNHGIHPSKFAIQT